MKRMVTLKNSPYYYTSSEWSCLGEEEKKKYARALVYDFLKKKGFLHKIYHMILKYNNTLSKKEVIPSFKECLDYTINKLVVNKAELRDYFFDPRAIGLNWNCMAKDDELSIRGIDKEWLKLIDDNIGK